MKRPIALLPARALNALMYLLVRARLARFVPPHIWYGAVAYIVRQENSR